MLLSLIVPLSARARTPLVVPSVSEALYMPGPWRSLRTHCSGTSTSRQSARGSPSLISRFTFTRGRAESYTDLYLLIFVLTFLNWIIRQVPSANIEFLYDKLCLCVEIAVLARWITRLPLPVSSHAR
jgi:hypothetical protein